MKPLGGKSYGSIPHLSGSRLGIGDHTIHIGQENMLTVKAPKDSLVIVQEKLDGSNVSVANVGGQLLALGRAGYLADSSRYQQHKYFAEWVRYNYQRFLFLKEGERLCGEWLLQAHGTKYNLPHEPFVAFDLIKGKDRVLYSELQERAKDFTLARLLHIGGAFPVEKAIEAIKTSGHGAIDPVEGAVWRLEREGIVDFLGKFVHHFKQDGIYFDPIVWNVDPKSLFPNV